ncbi:hypothetical protein E2C01_074130 [Portunus trituberculatus]|uniref:Uncharacterized protein n=1 Tax=Portunus trituberculatus TaxID=210409 RepID=A0A5B7IBK2_PORTR|nr:hypothetical protein [Portunus trituberculatus]
MVLCTGHNDGGPVQTPGETAGGGVVDQR